MSQDEQCGINRRRVLSSLGVVGTAGFGATSVAASTDSIREPSVKEAIRSNEVQSLLNELGSPGASLKGSTVSTRQVGGEDTDAYLSRVDIPLEQDSVTMVTYSELHDGSSTGVTEAFVDLADVPKRHRKPKWGQRGADVRLVSNGDKIASFRGVTEREKHRLAQLLGRNAETFVAGTNSVLDGYSVKATAEEEFTSFGPESNELIVKTSTHPFGSGITAEPEIIPVEEIPSVHGQCDDWCLTCASGITAAGTCLGVCAGVTAATPLIGWIACFTCAQGSGLVSGYACASCIDCKGLPI